MAAVADGAIVGSAIVKLIEKNQDKARGNRYWNMYGKMKAGVRKADRN